MRKAKFIFLKVALLTAIIPAYGNEHSDILKDEQGNSYKTVKIGEHVWMAENLKYKADLCSGNSDISCAYSGLYNWETAMTVCPKDWRLPTNADWEELTEATGGIKTDDRLLKEDSDQNNNGNDEDTYGFAAMPGNRNLKSLKHAIYYDSWWSSSEGKADFAYSLNFHYHTKGKNIYWYWYLFNKSVLLSVRCVKDSKESIRSKDEIMSVVNTNMPILKKIYRDYLKQKLDFEGKITLKFTIVPSGKITNIEIMSSTTDNPDFDNEIKNEVATWKWKEIKSGKVTPTIPFNFTDG